MTLGARLALFVASAVPFVVVGREAAAEARYMDVEEAVAAADTIAIVHAQSETRVDIEGEYWSYRQLVHAQVIATIVGAPAERIEIAASKTFVCAPARYEVPGDYLVFLADDNGHAVTVNHGMGRLAIVEGRVDWPYGEVPRMRPLDDVVVELRRIAAAQHRRREPLGALLELLPPSPAPTELAASPEPASWPAPLWMASGAFAVLLGMLVATRRRRSCAAPSASR